MSKIPATYAFLLQTLLQSWIPWLKSSLILTSSEIAETAIALVTGIWRTPKQSRNGASHDYSLVLGKADCFGLILGDIFTQSKCNHWIRWKQDLIECCQIQLANNMLLACHYFQGVWQFSTPWAPLLRIFPSVLPIADSHSCQEIVFLLYWGSFNWAGVSNGVSLILFAPPRTDWRYTKLRDNNDILQLQSICSFCGGNPCIQVITVTLQSSWVLEPTLTWTE